MSDYQNLSVPTVRLANAKTWHAYCASLNKGFCGEVISGHPRIAKGGEIGCKKCKKRLHSLTHLALKD